MVVIMLGNAASKEESRSKRSPEELGEWVDGHCGKGLTVSKYLGTFPQSNLKNPHDWPDLGRGGGDERGWGSSEEVRTSHQNMHLPLFPGIFYIPVPSTTLPEQLPSHLPPSPPHISGEGEGAGGPLVHLWSHHYRRLCSQPVILSTPADPDNQ